MMDLPTMRECVGKKEVNYGVITLSIVYIME